MAVVQARAPQPAQPTQRTTKVNGPNTKIRNNLRRKHGFSRDPQQLFNIEAIYSTEPMVYPDNKGETSSSKEFIQAGEKLDCGSGYGASTMITASFGLLAAARAIETLISTK